MKTFNLFSLLVGAFLIISCNSCTGDVGNQDDPQIGDEYFELQLHKFNLQREALMLEQQLENGEIDEQEFDAQMSQNQDYQGYLDDRIGFVVPELPPMPQPCICPVPIRATANIFTIEEGPEHEFSIFMNGEEIGGVADIQEANIETTTGENTFTYSLEINAEGEAVLRVTKYFEPLDDTIQYEQPIDVFMQ